MKSTGMKYLLVITACIAVMIFLFRDHIPFGKNNTDFAVDQTTDITGIDLMRGNRKVVIRRTGDQWTVNKTKEARKTAVLFLIKTLKAIKIKSPVSAEVFRSEIIDKKVEPVRVVVYEKRRPVRSFFVYPTASNIYGNIMKMKVISKPFIVYMPGYEENIGTHFIADELFWMPFSAFSLLPSQIESVEMQNIKDPASSFQINRDAKGFSLVDLSTRNGGWDSLKVRRFISYFTSVSFESWATDMTEAERRQIESSAPAYRIKVKTHAGKEELLTIWERVCDPVKGEMDTDRAWAEKDDGKGIFVMRYFDLDPILKKKSYFY
ncbi:MAG: hypothetical protein ABR974_13255 [Bacteroidales bacterium]|jgi:hypothetical protein